MSKLEFIGIHRTILETVFYYFYQYEARCLFNLFQVFKVEQIQKLISIHPLPFMKILNDLVLFFKCFWRIFFCLHQCLLELLQSY